MVRKRKKNGIEGLVVEIVQAAFAIKKLYSRIKPLIGKKTKKPITKKKETKKHEQ